MLFKTGLRICDQMSGDCGPNQWEERMFFTYQNMIYELELNQPSIK